MDIPGISASDSAFGSLNSTNDLGKDAFMELLVTQLSNQNPLEPTNNEEFIAQLANFSSLEEMEEVNTNLLTMIQLNQTNALLDQLTSSSALIGQQVTWTHPVTGVQSTGEVESVKLDQGLAILRVDGFEVPLAAIDDVLGEDAVASDSGDTESDSTDTDA